MPIKTWPITERPRERLLKEGVQKLSDAELLAVLLRNGIKGKDAVTFARELLTQFDGLRGFFAAGEKELQKIKGLGGAKIATLIAATELIRRKLGQEIVGKNIIRDPESLLAYLQACLRDRKKEVFKVLFLNKAHRIIGEKDIFEGTVDETAVHPREVIQAALEHHATTLLVVHNHPSGRAEPSPDDRLTTQKLQAACSAVGIQLLDHLIIGDNRYFSFCEEGLL